MRIFWRRSLNVFLVVALASSVLGVSPVGAQDVPAPDEPGEIEDGGLDELEVGKFDAPAPDDSGLFDDVGVPVVETAVTASPGRVERVERVDGLSEVSLRKGWLPVTASVKAQGGRPVQVGNSPVLVELDGNSRAVSDVAVNVLPPGLARQLSPLGAAAVVGFRNKAGVSVIPGNAYSVSLDLSDVPMENNGDLWERLSVSYFEGCELFEPDLAAFGDPEDGTNIDVAVPEDLVVCDDVTVLDADFDVETNVLSAKVNPGQIRRAQVQRRNELRKSGVTAADLDPKAGLKESANNGVGYLRAEGPPGLVKRADEAVGGLGPKGESNVVLARDVPAGFLNRYYYQTGSGSNPIVGASTGVSSSSGDFSALPTPTLTDAQVGLYTGSAELSYPIPVPAAAAGPAPSVGFVYSSAPVDGMTMGSNNQTGFLGTGWSLSVGGSIQRGLRACNDPAAVGDRCISGSPDDVYSLSLGGKSSKLVFVGTGTVNGSDFREFRLQSDEFWRIRLWTGTSEGVTVDTRDAFDH